MAWSLKQKRTRKKSPIKEPPLPAAGDSLGAEIEDVRENCQAYWFALAACMIAMIAMEWYCWYFNTPRMPGVMTALGLLVIAFSVWRGVLLELHMARLRDAQRGEQHVGQLLEQLRRDGYEVFHDLVFDDFNIDHALVGPAGVFSIETKTISKPPGNPRVTYDGEQLLVAGFPPDRDPIGQAKGEAATLRKIIQPFTAKSVQVRPVVLYPGWWVESEPGRCDVWVLGNGFPGFLRRQRRTLSEDDIRSYADLLTRHLQAQQKKRAAEKERA